MQSMPLILGLLILIALGYLLICLGWRATRLSRSMSDFAAGLPTMMRVPAQTRISHARQQLLKVDALIKDGRVRVEQQAPRPISPRSAGANADALVKAIADGLKSQSSELLVAGFDATLYGALVASDIDLKQFWESAATYLKENPTAIATLGFDLTEMLVLPSPEHAAQLAGHFKDILGHAAAGSFETADSLDGIGEGAESFLPDLGPIPVFTAIFSTVKALGAMSNGHATFGDAFQSVAWDVGGVGIGSGAGAILGGAILGPPGALIGAIVGGIFGRRVSNEFKYMDFKEAKRIYESELKAVNDECHAFVCTTYDAYANISVAGHMQYAAGQFADFKLATQTATIEAIVGDLVAALRSDCAHMRHAIERRAGEALAAHEDRWYHILFGCHVRGALGSKLRKCAAEASARISVVERSLTCAQTPEALLDVISSCAVPPCQTLGLRISAFERALSDYLARHVAEFRCWGQKATATGADLISDLANYAKERATEFEKLSKDSRERLAPYENAVWREARKQGMCP